MRLHRAYGQVPLAMFSATGNSYPMSIAVSTVVHPSRLLALLTAAMCLFVLSIGVLLAAGQVGALDPLVRSTLSAACIFLALFVCYRTVQNRKTHHIDISGHGQIRLMEHSALAGQSADTGTGELAGRPGQDQFSGEVVSLLAGSTLWPALLILRLRTEDQRVVVLHVLPDSVEGGGFRALSVACRWIAAHNNPSDHTQV